MEASKGRLRETKDLGVWNFDVKHSQNDRVHKMASRRGADALSLKEVMVKKNSPICYDCFRDDMIDGVERNHSLQTDL